MNDYERQALMTQHAALETKIAEQHSRPLPDEEQLRRLKVDKLRIKDQLEGVTQPAS